MNSLVVCCVVFFLFWFAFLMHLYIVSCKVISVIETISLTSDILMVLLLRQ